MLKYQLRIATKRAFERWQENFDLKLPFFVAARYCQQLDVLLQEKDELERKIETQTEQNEHLEALIAQADTECIGCQRKIMKLKEL